jgi:hypothetical protein
VPEIGRVRFAGNLAQKNMHWREYRNFLRQALSNFAAAQQVPNRSASLLLYYAALNFAKAELLDTNYSSLVQFRVGHGLSFSPTRAKSVLGDHLTVSDGVFTKLYERRTGKAWPQGQKLGVRQLLSQVPEIGSQVYELTGMVSRVARGFQLMAIDGQTTWSVLAFENNAALDRDTATSRLLRRHYSEVERPAHWRDHFGFSRQFALRLRFYESRQVCPPLPDGSPDHAGAMQLSLALRDILSLRTDESCDAWLTPYLFDTKPLALPASLARYALIYYASSVVRYKPAMFDGQLFPAQALLFDGIAREVALPILIDTLSAVRGTDQMYRASGSLRS